MKDVISEIVIKVIIWILDDKVKNEEVFTYGERAGKWLTANAKSAVGAGWNNLEDKLQDKLAIFMGGLGQGLNSDDQE